MNNREKLFMKQEGKCAMCGKGLHIDKSNCFDNYYLQIDHVKPASLGGRSHISNYRGLCRPCNSSKRNTSGDKLVKMLVRKQTESNMKKYHERIRDDLVTGNINEATIEELKKIAEKNHKETMDTINELLTLKQPQ